MTLLREGGFLPASAERNPFRPPLGPSLDATDYRILHLLERDARAPIAVIARDVGLTDNAVRYRLKRLHRLGVLRGSTVRVDPGRLGSVAGIVLLSGQRLDIDRLRALPHVAMLLPTSGAYQAAVIVLAQDPASLERVAQSLRDACGAADAMLLRVAPGTELPIGPSACGLPAPLAAPRDPGLGTS
jgi:Lrp/AsnC family transcriptional regulator for asnA, asnC and gidA